VCVCVCVCGGKLILIAFSFPFISVCGNNRHKELFVAGSYIFNKRKIFHNKFIYFQSTHARCLCFARSCHVINNPQNSIFISLISNIATVGVQNF
jgi:hypothetical protein